MSKSTELAIYAAVLFGIAATAIASSCCVKGSCEPKSYSLKAAEPVWITDRRPRMREAKFGGLVWIIAENGVQLRFDFNIEKGTPWQAVVPPEGKINEIQTNSLRNLFGG